ncbi:MAG: hypothetical protein JSV21_01755, partial [Nitrospirota bacterium]
MRSYLKRVATLKKEEAMTKRTLHRLLPILVAIAFLVACGGGGNSGSGSVEVISEGVMTKGSVIVNGVTFNAAGATITKDDNPATEIELEDGMVVKVKGHRNDDGVTGTADAVETENEITGEIESINPTQRGFRVLNQYIYADDQTIYYNVINFGGLNTTDFVEVHGQRDADNRIRASRIELLGGDPGIDELKGFIEAGTLSTGAGTFAICSGPVAIEICTGITTSGATSYGPAPAVTSINDLSEGDLVEVEGNYVGGTLAATKIHLEDLEDAEFEPVEGQEVEYEG